jgi:hypothetical protein
MERTIMTGEAEEIIGFATTTHEHDFRHRSHHLIEKKNYTFNNVAAGREYVAEFIDFILYFITSAQAVLEKQVFRSIEK